VLERLAAPRQPDCRICTVLGKYNIFILCAQVVSLFTGLNTRGKILLDQI